MIVDIDLRDALCLACFSSLLSEKQAAHITKCCKQVICDSCIRTNPRLATYEPCLACLGGVGASRGNCNFQSPKALLEAHNMAKSGLHRTNVNDSETMFVLGDDSDEDTEKQDANSTILASPVSPPSNNPPPPYQEKGDPTSDPPPVLTSPPDATSSSTLETSILPPMTSRKYYMNPCDTIHGVALRFGVDARDLCRTNGLPFSTLSTTPHLLHTRAFLTLPPSSKPIPLQYVLSEDDQAKRNSQRVKERAEKRLQMVTKELDCRVAKTYVALASDPNPEFQDDLASTCKERPKVKVPISKSTAGQQSAGIESRAVNMYLEDEEWEQNELSAGRSSHIPQLPVRPAAVAPDSGTRAKWWPWNS